MQVVAVGELPDGSAWSYEAKLDGYRCLAAKRGSGVVLWSRNGNGFSDRFPQIARACEKLPADTLIDGEVIVLDDNGRKGKDYLGIDLNVVWDKSWGAS